jgi:hypothetical protein
MASSGLTCLAGPRDVSRPRIGDRLFVALASILLILVSSVPSIYGYLAVPPDRWFSGIAFNMHDTAQYFSWMRESGTRFLIENKLTSEPNPAVYFNLHWWLAGRFAALAGLGLSTTYQLCRLLLIPLYVLVAYWLCGLMFAERGRRRFAFVLTTCASGAGWLWVVEKYVSHRADLAYPLDVHNGNAATLIVLSGSPHSILALALTLAVLGLAWLGLRRRAWRFTVAASGLALFLGFGHVYDLVTVWAVLGAFGVLVTLRDRFSLDTFARLFAVVLISAPAPLYFGWLSSSSPTWKEALAQYDNLGVHTPDPLHLAILLGLPLLTALSGAVAGRRPLRAMSDRDLFLFGWLVANLAILYLPVQFQVMLLNGLQFVLCALSTDWMYNVLVPWLDRRATRLGAAIRREMLRAAPYVLVLLVLPTSLYFLSWRVYDLSRADYPYYLSRGDAAALSWLAVNSQPDTVVFSAFATGHFVPGLAGNRAFLANAVMTLDFEEKRQTVQRFYGAGESDEWRLATLRRYGVRYVLYGPAERAVGTYEPERSTFLRRAFESAGTAIYELAPPRALLLGASR